MLHPNVESIVKKAQLTGMLELVCQALELTESQFKTAEARYEAVGKYLIEGDSPVLASLGIYPQGSISLGTTVKPVGQEEYDIDLVCLAPSLQPAISPGFLKKLIGDRLRSSGRYRDLLEEKPRCWRINYANEFHLDITPAIANPACGNGGELVPDKKLEKWKASNPKGYRRQFEEIAKLQPVMSLKKAAEFAAARSQVEDLPQPTKLKGILKRCVQLCKRHRDLRFRGSNLAPISVIITTLAARSYAACVRSTTYDTELDVLIDVIGRMPQFIETHKVGEQTLYFLWNETTAGENFAEKWNEDHQLARAFYLWHTQILSDIHEFFATDGLDSLQASMCKSFGDAVVGRAFSSLTNSVSALRGAGRLGVAHGGRLSLVSPAAVKVRPNTFFGAH